MAPNSNVQLIEKEQIKNLTFPKEDVLNQTKQKANRILELRRALTLGNIEHQKVKILFVDNNGLKKVETTIWGITDKEVILKKSTIIPLERIIRIS